MKKMIILLCLIILIGVVTFVMLNKNDQNNEPSVSESNIGESNLEKQAEVGSENATNVEVDQKEPVVDEQEARRQEMINKFSDLKEIRKTTKMQISRLSSRLRRSEFAPDQAKRIAQDMRRAGYILKNPKLLGAFSGPSEIDQELRQLSDVNIRLDEIKQVLDDKRKKQP